MSEQAKTARAAMKAKAHRLAGKTDPHQKVDASSWTPSEPEAATSQTGMRPVSPRQYKRGGKVVGKHEGEHAKHHAGRKPRKAGGKALTPDNLINRNVKEANEQRPGTKHVGGMKAGGRAKKMDGGPMAAMPPAMANPRTAALVRAMADAKMRGAMPGGMPMMRKEGGRAGHPDEAEDRALVKKMVKHGALTGKKDGGRTRKAGGGSSSKYPVDWDKVHLMPGPEKPDIAGYYHFLATGEQPEGDGQVHLMPGPEQPLPVPGRKHGGKAGGKWIQGAIKHPGALHKALHVPEGEKIPAKKLKKAEHSKNPLMAKRAHLAETLGKMHHAHGGVAGHPDGCRCHKCWGGKTGKKHGGAMSVSDGEMQGTRPTGGRLARKDGGRAKGKTNINIVISPHGAAGGAPMQPPMGMPPRPPAQPVQVPPTPPGGMPPGGMMPMPMPMPMPSPAAPPPAPMGRKRGGRTVYPDMEYGAGSGKGRLEKIKEYG